jgi:hypothetical protein
MPTYTSTNKTSVFTIGPCVRFAPETITTTQEYAKTLPSGVTLTSHEPLVQPWALLATVSSVPSSDVDVSAWDNIIIYNASNGIVTISANGDDDHAIVVMPSSKEVWNNVAGLFGALTALTNAGTGNIYVWGSR